MVLYVMRHGEAVEANEDLTDEWRYLTENGIKSAMNVSSNLAKHGRKPRLIISSPLVRAVQTAQIAAAYACRRNVLIVSGLLQSNGDPGDLQDFLRSHGEAKRIMLVGHEPQLGLLIAGLLQKEVHFPLKKGSCVALELDNKVPDKPARFIWYLVPGKKPVTSLKKAFAQK